MVSQGKTIEALFLITVAPLVLDDVRLAIVILEDIREITLLRQIVPICAHCKQVRNDENYWQSVESYLGTNLEIDCSHSLCPSCAQKIFPEYSAEEMGLGPEEKQPSSNTSTA